MPTGGRYRQGLSRVVRSDRTTAQARLRVAISRAGKPRRRRRQGAVRLSAHRGWNCPPGHCSWSHPDRFGHQCSRMMPVIMGLLLIACGIQVGEWVGANGRLSNILGSIVATCMAVMFAWVAINGDAPNFYGGMSAGRAAVAFNSPTVLAR